MDFHHFSPRLALFFCLLFVVTACSQTSLEQPGSTAARSSPQAQTPTPSALLTLQRRLLHFPVVAPGASCPTTAEKKVNPSFGITQGDGPAYATIGTEVMMSPAVFSYADAQHFADGGTDNQGWGGKKVLWFVNPHYQGLILVRGQQLDGPHEMRFGQPLQEQLELDTTLGGDPWPNFPSYTRLQTPGCYAYQVDGNNFSYVIVFQAVVSN